MCMKRFWWSWVVVFLIGIWTGGMLLQPQKAPGTELPSFSTPQVSVTTPTLPAKEPEPTYVQTGYQEGLPCNVKYTPLVAWQLMSYDGPYLEDGTEEELIGVAALVVENTGTIGIEFVQLVVSQGQRELVFNATYIPPRGTVMILEKERQSYTRETVTGCKCRTLIPGTFDWEKGNIHIEPGNGFSMAVTNLTEETMPYVRVFYKQHEGESDLYVGGITFSAVIPDLQPGETREITPYRYANGYSAVVAVVIDS